MILIRRVEYKEVCLRILYNNDFFPPIHSVCIQQVTHCGNTCRNDCVTKADSNKI